MLGCVLYYIRLRVLLNLVACHYYLGVIQLFYFMKLNVLNNLIQTVFDQTYSNRDYNLQELPIKRRLKKKKDKLGTLSQVRLPPPPLCTWDILK